MHLENHDEAKIRQADEECHQEEERARFLEENNGPRAVVTFFLGKRHLPTIQPAWLVSISSRKRISSAIA